MKPGVGAFENYDRLRKQMAVAMDTSRIGADLASASGFRSVMEQHRQTQKLLDGPTRVFTEPLETLTRPAMLQLDDLVTGALRPLVAQQNRVVANMLSSPGYTSMLRELERGPFQRIEELSRVALGSAGTHWAFDGLADLSALTRSFDSVFRALQGAAVAADVEVFEDEAFEAPEWLTGFAARVQALPASEQRALALNLAIIAMFMVSTALTWSAVGGTTAAWFQSGGLVGSLLAYANRISALYEHDEDQDEE